MSLLALPKFKFPNSTHIHLIFSISSNFRYACPADTGCIAGIGGGARFSGLMHKNIQNHRMHLRSVANESCISLLRGTYGLPSAAHSLSPAASGPPAGTGESDAAPADQRESGQPRQRKAGRQGCADYRRRQRNRQSRCDRFCQRGG
ncbi:hypothetical protein D3C75_832520 [compost metagenome]